MLILKHNWNMISKQTNTRWNKTNEQEFEQQYPAWVNYSAPRRNSYGMKNLHVRYRLLPYKLLVMEAPEAPKTRRLFPVLLALNRAR